MIREWVRLLRLPLVPAQSRKAPMEAARPTHTVCTSGLMCCMVSKMPRPS